MRTAALVLVIVLPLLLLPAGAAQAMGAVDVIVLWDPAAVAPPDPGLLGAFLGTVRSEDRLGVAAVGGGASPALPLQTFSVGGALSAAYEVGSALGTPAGKGDLRTGLDEALRHLDRGKRPGATLAVVVVTRGSAEAATDGDAGALVAGEEILATLLMKEVAVYSLTVGGFPGQGLGSLVESSGGKAVSIATDADAVAGLALVYDSLQLRAWNLSLQRVEPDGGPVDYRYLDEVVATPDEGVAKDARRAKPVQADVARGPDPLILALLALLIAVNAAALVTAFLRGRGHGGAPRPGAPGAHRVNESPSFSRLTLGLNGFRKSFADAEHRLDALGLDLEDYGAQSWDLERRLMDEYVSLAQKVFLLLDHLRLERGPGEGPSRPESKLARLLEDSGIDEIAPRPGEEFDGRYHVHSGERGGTVAPGAVLEVSRVGYVKAEGLVHGEPLVLRKAEVIVCGRPGGGRGDGGDA